MATAQINARIDAQLKTGGNAALNEAGYSPTEAVRALWEFANRNRHDHAALHSLFDLLNGTARQTEDATRISARVASVEAGAQLFEQTLEHMGVNAHNITNDASYEELLEQAYLEKMTERGLL